MDKGREIAEYWVTGDEDVSELASVINAALDAARREGAEAMKHAAVFTAQEYGFDLDAAHSNAAVQWNVAQAIAEKIRALPSSSKDDAS